MNSTHSAWVGTKCNVHIKRLDGHWLYCRRCETPEPEGLILPEWTRDYSLWFEVLAIGTEVGRERRWPFKLLKERKVSRCMCDCYRVDDIILLPDDHPWGIKLSPYAEDERFIDEAVPECVVALGERDGGTS